MKICERAILLVTPLVKLYVQANLDIVGFVKSIESFSEI